MELKKVSFETYTECAYQRLFLYKFTLIFFSFLFMCQSVGKSYMIYIKSNIYYKLKWNKGAPVIY